ncbi:MAG: hypothetical protein A2096_05620 [Spirochaetes bacterium GWF1_41_5]|nr:MAG: hypothetical protein A2096_05620 [Spirochaetes bacterium GWF1_41_5]
MKKFEVIRQTILDRIQNGVFGSGGKLPNRDQLVSEFSSTRATINKAMSCLLQDGVIRAVRNKGTFVSAYTIRRAALITGSSFNAPLQSLPYLASALYFMLFNAPAISFSFINAEDNSLWEHIRRFPAVIWPFPGKHDLPKIRKNGNNILVLNRYGKDLNYISTNHRQGMRDLAGKLLSFKKCVNLFYLDIKMPDFVLDERRKGAQDACHNTGINIRFINMAMNFEENFKILQKRIPEKILHRSILLAPTARFTGAVLYHARCCRKIPGKNFFFGDFDNPGSQENTGIRIPSVLQDYKSMGEEALWALPQILINPVQKFIPHNLINI